MYCVILVCVCVCLFCFVVILTIFSWYFDVCHANERTFEYVFIFFAIRVLNAFVETYLSRPACSKHSLLLFVLISCQNSTASLELLYAACGACDVCNMYDFL